MPLESNPDDENSKGQLDVVDLQNASGIVRDEVLESRDEGTEIESRPEAVEVK